MFRRKGILGCMLKRIWNCMSAKYLIELWGQSPETVFIRSLFFGTSMFVIAIILLGFFKYVVSLYAPGINVSKCTDSTFPFAECFCSISRDFFNDSKIVLGVIGFWWSCYSGLRQEFVSKFEYLTRSVDALLQSGSYVEKRGTILICGKEVSSFEINSRALNFAEDCITFNLYRNGTFSWTFRDIMSHMAYLRENDHRLYVCLIDGHEKIEKFLAQNEENRNSLVGRFHHTEKIDAELACIRKLRTYPLKENV